MRRLFRFRLRTLLLAMFALALLFAYVGSYVRLARRGRQEAEIYGLKGFLYASCAEIETSHDLTRHHQLASFYAPVNWVDRQFFGGEVPVGYICFIE